MHWNTEYFALPSEWERPSSSCWLQAELLLTPVAFLNCVSQFPLLNLWGALRRKTLTLSSVSQAFHSVFDFTTKMNFPIVFLLLLHAGLHLPQLKAHWKIGNVLVDISWCFTQLQQSGLNIDSVILKDVSVNLIKENPSLPHASLNVLYSMCRLSRNAEIWEGEVGVNWFVMLECWNQSCCCCGRNYSMLNFSSAKGSCYWFCCFSLVINELKNVHSHKSTSVINKNKNVSTVLVFSKCLQR